MHGLHVCVRACGRGFLLSTMEPGSPVYSWPVPAIHPGLSDLIKSEERSQAPAVRLASERNVLLRAESNPNHDEIHNSIRESQGAPCLLGGLTRTPTVGEWLNKELQAQELQAKELQAKERQAQ